MHIKPRQLQSLQFQLHAKPTGTHSSKEPPNEFKLSLAETWAKAEQYIALSHCWGKEPLLGTTTATKDRFHQDIPWVQLPQNFKEAVEVTAFLGFSYI